MAIQVEGNRLTLRWHETGLDIVRVNGDDPLQVPEAFEMNVEEANEFAQLWAIGEGAIMTGQRFMPHFPLPNVISQEEDD